MGCGTTCARVLLIVFTLLLSIVGLVILAAGLILKFGAETILKPYIELALKGINNLISQGANSGISSGNNTTTDSPGGSDNDFSILLQPITVILISFGAVIAIISLIGFIGACCKTRCLLYFYAILVGLTALAVIILPVVVLSGAVNKGLQKEFLKTIEDNYQGLQYQDPHSLAWNYIMIQFKCCGVFGYEDFNNSEHWNREVTKNNYTYTLITPVACCKMNGTFPDVTPLDEQCSVYPNDATSNWKTGCWDEVTNYVAFYKPFIILGVTGIVLIMVLVIVWSCVVAHKMNSVYPV